MPNPNWKKGVSGNPGGRPKGLAATVRELVDVHELVAVLLDIAHNTGAEARDRISATKELLDRGYGKPHQSITMDADLRHEVLDMLVMTPEQRARRLADLEERRRLQLEAPSEPVADVSEAKRSGPTE